MRYATYITIQVVDRESAVIQGTIKRSAERLHREIQGCQSLNDETYEDVVRYIKRWLKAESERKIGQPIICFNWILTPADRCLD